MNGGAGRFRGNNDCSGYILKVSIGAVLISVKIVVQRRSYDLQLTEFGGGNCAWFLGSQAQTPGGPGNHTLRKVFAGLTGAPRSAQLTRPV